MNLREHIRIIRNKFCAIGFNEKELETLFFIAQELISNTIVYIDISDMTSSVKKALFREGLQTKKLESKYAIALYGRDLTSKRNF